MRIDYDHQPPPPNDFNQSVLHHEPKRSSSGCLKYIILLVFLLEAGLIIGFVYTLANPSTLNALVPVLCPEAKAISVDSWRSASARNETVYNIVCVDEDNRTIKDVTGAVIAPFIIAMILLPFMGVGLIMLVVGNKVRNTISHATTTQSHVWTTISAASAGSREASNLKQRLIELQEAYDAGLISLAEYEEKRQELLAKF